MAHFLGRGFYMLTVIRNMLYTVGLYLYMLKNLWNLMDKPTMISFRNMLQVITVGSYLLKKLINKSVVSLREIKFMMSMKEKITREMSHG